MQDEQLVTTVKKGNGKYKIRGVVLHRTPTPLGLRSHGRTRVTQQCSLGRLSGERIAQPARSLIIALLASDT